ncbi:MAG: FAD-dependent oxidoreductase [Betaproteobacteria bacterium]|nr:FAD-dependent oxidoreductase [Betaproteobacteria bacterium]NBY04355.1 FAD-dependent oxidoreductase [Betaproteobacteria bacterium]
MASQRIAIVGAGMAGITAARTLVQSGQDVTVFDKSAGTGGRMATRRTVFGGFDHGAQYFTVRDARLALALQSVPDTLSHCRPWSANAVRVLDPSGRVVEAARPGPEAHWVGVPGMSALVKHWAQPLADAGQLHLSHQVLWLQADPLKPSLWAVHGVDALARPWHQGGFDRVLLAIPAPQCAQLLQASPGRGAASGLIAPTLTVQTAPCWSLMLAFPLASQPGLNHLGPQWNAARSTHHRIAWLARESSKPGRSSIERWTVQASAEWSSEHLHDDAERVQHKLMRAFSELTGIHTVPNHAQAHLWRYAKTTQPLGQPYQWDPSTGLGTCGDWHLGQRVEDAFVSGLELGLRLCVE